MAPRANNGRRTLAVQDAPAGNETTIVGIEVGIVLSRNGNPLLNKCGHAPSLVVPKSE